MSHQGASLKALEMLGRQEKYSLVGCDFLGVNAFFAHDDLLVDEFCGPYTSENHFEPQRLFLYRRNSAPRKVGRFVIPDQPWDAEGLDPHTGLPAADHRPRHSAERDLLPLSDG